MRNKEEHAELDGPRNASLVLLLHAHLPYCRRPDHPGSLEENWFFEALTESYLPFVRMLDRLQSDGVAARLTLSLSPTLLCLLRDEHLLKRYRDRLAAVEKIARREARTGDFKDAAGWQASFFEETLRTWDGRCGGDLLAVLREYADAGRIELATTAATHAFLPAFQGRPDIVETQVRVGLDMFEDIFGFLPSFFWLPECGYFPGLETPLKAAGIRAFGLEHHGITRARPPSETGVHAPLRCPNGVVALARDREISRRVWSAREGYPGHPHYREFHRDRIHELPESALGEWMVESGVRLPSGLKYWRVSEPGREKAFYDPKAASKQAEEHAEHFLNELRKVARAHGSATPAPLWFAPFDAELFGHWWFEGPIWLESLFRAMATQDTVVAVSASEAAARYVRCPQGIPAPSSWGNRGDYSQWINRETDWIYPVLFDSHSRLMKLIEHRADGAATGSPYDRALRQTARTLLLAQASDWPFMMTTGTAADLANNQMERLFSRLERLCADLENGTIDSSFLCECEALDGAFPGLRLDRFTP